MFANIDVKKKFLPTSSYVNGWCYDSYWSIYK